MWHFATGSATPRHGGYCRGKANRALHTLSHVSQLGVADSLGPTLLLVHVARRWRLREQAYETHCFLAFDTLRICSFSRPVEALEGQVQVASIFPVPMLSCK